MSNTCCSSGGVVSPQSGGGSLGGAWQEGPGLPSGGGGITPIGQAVPPAPVQPGAWDVSGAKSVAGTANLTLAPGLFGH